MSWIRDGIPPTRMAQFHMISTVIFFILIIPSVTLWKESVPYLVAISVWANFAGHLAAWQAARVEVKQDALEERQEDLEEDYQP